jgi:predicted 3-demethylubiquinone-9 3-methyltransferase (glyoxalase superfamily)
MTITTTISPCLWFDSELEEAAEFYTRIFPNSSVGHLARYPASGPGEPGKVMAGEFTIDGLTFRAINGGPQFRFTEAVSFSVNCRDQAEVDHYWEALGADGGEESVCGWLKDRYGLSWQVVPRKMLDWWTHMDEKSERAFAAMMKMGKLDIAALERAYEGRQAA